MFNHIVLLTWKNNATTDDIIRVEKGFSELPDKIPEIKEYRFGANLGIHGSNFNYALVAGFDNRKDFESYMNHPDHVDFMEKLSEPIVESHAAVQFED